MVTERGCIIVSGDNSAAVDFVFAYAIFLYKLVHLIQIPAVNHHGYILGAAKAAGSRP